MHNTILFGFMLAKVADKKTSRNSKSTKQGKKHDEKANKKGRNGKGDTVGMIR